MKRKTQNIIPQYLMPDCFTLGMFLKMVKRLKVPTSAQIMAAENLEWRHVMQLSYRPQENKVLLW